MNDVILKLASAYPFPTKAVTQLAWKPVTEPGENKNDIQLAISSEDSSLRIYSLRPEIVAE